MRINKFLATYCRLSRRRADKEVESGHVVVNAKIAELGQEIDIEKDSVTWLKKKIRAEEIKKIYILLNKPKNILSSVGDDRGRQTVTDLVDIEEKVFPVGRLDFDTSGLIILTNDGEFSNLMTHPKYHVEKIYLAEVKGKINRNQIQRLREGVMIEFSQDGQKRRERTMRCSVRVRSGNEHMTVLEIILRQGLNRQIKRMLESQGLELLALKRVGIGELKTGRLRSGEWRYLLPTEVDRLKKLAS